MDLEGGAFPRRLVLNAQKLDYGDTEQVRLLLTISDVTEARISEKLKDDLLREKAILLQELQHRRSEEHTSELQSLMRISYAVFCLKKTNKKHTQNTSTTHIY